MKTNIRCYLIAVTILFFVAFANRAYSESSPAPDDTSTAWASVISTFNGEMDDVSIGMIASELTKIVIETAIKISEYEALQPVSGALKSVDPVELSNEIHQSLLNINNIGAVEYGYGMTKGAIQGYFVDLVIDVASDALGNATGSYAVKGYSWLYMKQTYSLAEALISTNGNMPLFTVKFAYNQAELLGAVIKKDVQEYETARSDIDAAMKSQIYGELIALDSPTGNDDVLNYYRTNDSSLKQSYLVTIKYSAEQALSFYLNSNNAFLDILSSDKRLLAQKILTEWQENLEKRLISAQIEAYSNFYKLAREGDFDAAGEILLLYGSQEHISLFFDENFDRNMLLYSTFEDVTNEPTSGSITTSTMSIIAPPSVSLSGQTLSAPIETELTLLFDKYFAGSQYATANQEFLMANATNLPITVQYNQSDGASGYADAHWDSYLNGLTFSVNTSQPFTLVNISYDDSSLAGIELGVPNSFVLILNNQTSAHLGFGYAHSLSLKNDGSLWAWGDNTYGQLGNGSTTSSADLVRIGTDRDWAQVTGGFRHSVAIKKDGSLWHWGKDPYNTAAVETKPVLISSSKEWVITSSNGGCSYAIKKDGSLWSWGYNPKAALGLGSITSSSYPYRIGTSLDWESVYAGGDYAFAIKKDGSLWSWGTSYYGELGTGLISSTSFKTSPVRVGTLNNWKTIAADGFHALGVQADGSLWAWGLNTSGQLGLGDTSQPVSRPVRVGTESDWLGVAAGVAHSLAVKTDGSLWGWGSNVDGRIGDGSTINRYAPVRIGGDTDWVQVFANAKRSGAIKKDGSVYIWGLGVVENEPVLLDVGTLLPVLQTRSLVSEFPIDNALDKTTFIKEWEFDQDISGLTINVVGNTYANIVDENSFEKNGARLSIELTPDLTKSSNRLDLLFTDDSGSLVKVDGSDTFWAVSQTSLPPQLALSQKTQVSGLHGEIITLPISAYDPDGDQINISIGRSVGELAYIDENNNLILEGMDQDSVHSVDLRISAGSQSITETFTIFRYDLSSSSSFYSDVLDTHPYFGDIYFATIVGAVGGERVGPPRSTTRIFRPDDNASWAEALAMVINSSGIAGLIDELQANVQLKATPQWAEKYYTFARQRGAIEINPDDLASTYPTREEVARLIVRTLELEQFASLFKNASFGFEDEIDFSSDEYLLDGKMTSFFGLFMNEAVANPQAYVSRGELAAVITKIFQMPTATLDFPAEVNYGTSMDLLILTHPHAVKVGSNNTATDSSGEVNVQYAFNRRHISANTFDTNILPIGINEVLVLLENQGVLSIMITSINVVLVDADLDGVQDQDDAWPNDPRYSTDINQNGIPDSLDQIYGLSYLTSADSLTFYGEEVTVEQIITDGYVILTEVDDDNDGVRDDIDAFPNDATETVDNDGDGVGDNADAFDNDAAASADSDGDGYPDAWNTDKTQIDSTTGLELDAFPFDPSESADNDGDGVGDNADDFDSDPAASVDSDGDGYPDAWNTGMTQADSTTGLSLDAFPSDPTEWIDSDGDGVGDNSDPFPDDLSETKDTDGDGVGDNTDAFPNDLAASIDSDGDGYPDSWNEGKTATDSTTGLSLDAFSDDPIYALDADSDNIPDEWEVVVGLSTSTDNSATDSDGDGVLDGEEFTLGTHPLQLDSDGDGLSDGAEVASGTDPLGDNSTMVDTDGDGLPDSYEVAMGLDEGVANSPGHDIDSDGFSDYFEYLYGLDSLVDNSTDLDSDGDGILDAVESVTGTDPNLDDGSDDPDSDGLSNLEEINRGTLPTIDNSLLADADSDGLPDLSEILTGTNPSLADSDADDIDDGIDLFPNDPSESSDTDGDGVGDNNDVFPNDVAASIDSDGDGYPDTWNTGMTQVDSTTGLVLDVFPSDPTESGDSDGDGVGNNADAFPNDTTETVDSDGDGVGNNADVFPNDATEIVDTDGDGVGDNSDAFATDSAASGDSDGDGYPDSWNTGRTEADSTTGLSLDTFPDDANEWADSDGDGMGNNADPFPDNPSYSVDADHDNIPDEWEETVGLSTSTDNSATDSDGDGVLDGSEFTLGTHPLQLDSDSDGLSDGAEVANGTDPLTDNTSMTDADGDGLPDSYEIAMGLDDTVANGPDQDSDGDGYSDYYEYLYGLDPLLDNSADADSDGDGILDSVESVAGTDPSVADASDDPDGDGITNLEEIASGTLPTVDNDTLVDTDGDGIPDITEVLAGTDPDVDSQLTDTDGDGINDLIEYQNGTLTTDNADLVDTDGDGLPDVFELANGLDPDVDDSETDSDNDGMSDLYEYQYGFDPQVEETYIGNGDLDRNGVIEVSDALLALRMAIGKIPCADDDIRYGDIGPLVNGHPSPDGQISIGDAMVILRKAVGLVNW